MKVEYERRKNPDPLLLLLLFLVRYVTAGRNGAGVWHMDVLVALERKGEDDNADINARGKGKRKQPPLQQQPHGQRKTIEAENEIT